MIKYTEINIENWDRRVYFNYFKDYDYPYVGLTANIDITDIYAFIKHNDYPFFLTMMYVVSKAADSVKEFRYRVLNNKVIEIERGIPSYTILLENKTFAYVNGNTSLKFEEYIKNAKENEEICKQNPSIEDGNDLLAYYFFSSIPWVSFTSLIQPTNRNDGDYNPRLTFGKYFLSEGRMKLPLAVLANHSLIDGYHIGELFAAIDEEMKEVMHLDKKLNSR